MAVLIKNVQILGSLEKHADSVDVFVSGEKISAIGNFPGKKADEVVDGGGAYLAPGFIDVNTDSDHYLSLFDHPSQEDFLNQGVTTIIGGQCGSSLAPLLYGSLESIQKWADVATVNVDWHTLPEFLSILDRRPLAVNFGTMIGHSTVRRAVVGEQIRDLTKNELTVFAETLRRALQDGGFGMSTGLGYVHSYGTPYSELKFLAQIVKEYSGIYSTHLRKGEKELGESIDETIKLARETGVKTLISHFVPIKGYEREYRSALEEIDKLPQDVDFNFDIYPSDTTVLPIYVFLPLWVRSGGRDVMIANLKDGWLWPKILKDMPEVVPDDFILARAPGNEVLVGRSLRELGEIYGIMDAKAALLKLMDVVGLNGTIFYRNINASLIRDAIANKRSIIASNAASFPYSGKRLKPERAVSTFTKYLGMCEKEGIMTLEEAVRKVTWEPARKFELRGRGVVKEGNYADLVVFLRRKETENKNATDEKDVEVKCVVVNGKVVLKDGIFKKQFPGKALRHNVQ